MVLCCHPSNTRHYSLLGMVRAGGMVVGGGEGWEARSGFRGSALTAFSCGTLGLFTARNPMTHARPHSAGEHSLERGHAGAQEQSGAHAERWALTVRPS